jgi:hypothetical protein
MVDRVEEAKRILHMRDGIIPENVNPQEPYLRAQTYLLLEIIEAIKDLNKQ